MLTSTRSARPRAAAARRVRASSAPGILYPLDFVYARAGVAPPSVKRIAPTEIPEPYRSLLVHESDMTITLERHFGGRVTLRPLSTFTVGGSYFRRVLLAQEYSGRPVEMGAIRMKLDVFSPRIRALIHANEVPLGRAYRPTHDERTIREFVLQLKKGSIRPAYFREKYGVNVLERFRDQLASIRDDGYLQRLDEEQVALTRDGLLRVDVLLHRFFLPQHTAIRYT